ncbi:tyrosyl-DNA phosphodiesterase 2-like [Zingiber officinale]|uniref:Endonuclease/exonuclease/phosphatase domain-containing protein n=1 Tax=Zingiber officinale TaxID=94328 RepID=A0A8J5LC96_ZINOF|nr:tyrosyl-DNA phosphodiesterase 2-like [Zingiber officinale]KAG6512891.1 hypothetical protein ZIOFF_031030 [Zingiber officinale]
MGNSVSSSGGKAIAFAGAAVLAWGASHLLNSLSNDEALRSESTKKSSASPSSTPDAPAASGRNKLAEEESVTLRSGKTDLENRDAYASCSEASSTPTAPPAAAASGRNKMAEETSVTLRSDKTHASGSEEFPRWISAIQMPRVITIVTYNIWQDDVKLKERMKAIGVLMQVKMPDIILFQEVTPKIHKIFEGFKWWQRYTCVSHKTATTRHYCMLLSKFPVKDLGWVHFKDSIGKKKLIVVEIEASGKRRRLVVANGHLKKPDLPDRWHTMKRTAQANEAIAILGEYENVIFGGDMNWSEEVDGCFPLPDGWVDAWEHLRPREKGWTYDTKSNLMIQGRRWLRRRLDRFLCKLKDYELASIDIIGKDIIPGLVHQYREKDYPVLCSDHFGLLLGISI